MKQIITDATASTISDPFQIRDIYADVPDARKDALFSSVTALVTGDNVFTVSLEVGPTDAGPFEPLGDIGRHTLVDMTARAWYRFVVEDGGQTGTISVWAG